MDRRARNLLWIVLAIVVVAIIALIAYQVGVNTGSSQAQGDGQVLRVPLRHFMVARPVSGGGFLGLGRFGGGWLGFVFLLALTAAGVGLVLAFLTRRERGSSGGGSRWTAGPSPATPDALDAWHRQAHGLPPSDSPVSAPASPAATGASGATPPSQPAG